MPVCEQCGEKWTWKEMMRLSFKNGQPCTHCGKIQYSYLKFFRFFLVILLFQLVLNISRYVYEFTLPATLLYAFFLMFPLLLLVPFASKLRSRRYRFGKPISE